MGVVVIMGYFLKIFVFLLKEEAFYMKLKEINENNSDINDIVMG